MQCLSVVLLCYRIACLWFCNKGFLCNKKGVLFMPDPVDFRKKGSGERGWENKRDREISIGCLPYPSSWGSKAQPRICALNGNPTHSISVPRTMFHPTKQPGQSSHFFWCINSILDTLLTCHFICNFPAPGYLHVCGFPASPISQHGSLCSILHYWPMHGLWGVHASLSSPRTPATHLLNFTGPRTWLTSSTSCPCHQQTSPAEHC